jgi:hypothetical protein
MSAGKENINNNGLILRGDFLQNRVFFAKSAQNLATRPTQKMLPRHLGFQNFPKFAKTNNRILLDF